LKCFLPEMSAANAKLDEQIQQSPDAYNIEKISESDERVIEMVSSIIHCVPKKVYPLMFDSNFGKCGPIFKIF